MVGGPLEVKCLSNKFSALQSRLSGEMSTHQSGHVEPLMTSTTATENRLGGGAGEQGWVGGGGLVNSWPRGGNSGPFLFL